MIITCPNCKKKFEIDPSLIPPEGRDLQCSSCNYVWFYEVEVESPKPLKLNETISNDEKEKNVNKKNESTDKTYNNKQPEITNKTKKNLEKTSNKFFSYLVVFILSFIALVILVDTLKTPLINTFPGLEIILFNLFETLQDLKLFIIDLY
tara:strand:- start:385 stop:834 length:450 start_codon:yes stop_codon:yes gene_type:complete